MSISIDCGKKLDTRVHLISFIRFGELDIGSACPNPNDLFTYSSIPHDGSVFCHSGSAACRIVPGILPTSSQKTRRPTRPSTTGSGSSDFEGPDRRTE